MAFPDRAVQGGPTDQRVLQDVQNSELCGGFISEWIPFFWQGPALDYFYELSNFANDYGAPLPVICVIALKNLKYKERLKYS